MTLKEMRVSKGLMSAFVSKQLGITYRQFKRIEDGEGYLTIERIKLLAKLYNVKMSEIEEGAKKSERIN